MRRTDLGLMAVPPPPTIDYMERYYQQFGDKMELLHLDGAIGRQIRSVKAAAETARRAGQFEVAAGLELAQDTLEDAREALRR
jgi:hypothetical protein